MKKVLAGVMCLGFGGMADAEPAKLALDIKGTSLTELMDLEVTSLSRKPEELNKVPAAVHVITSEQIQRLGVTHIAEVLRYAPGVEVARLAANRWAISIRGFNSGNANKLLVMIDGRSIYTPLYSGVFWEEKDVLLEDVARIEIIRGPGGTHWGANAVNGVINIITKDAESTQGGLVKLGAGLEERGLVAARYGGKLGEDTFARVYGKLTRRDESALAGPIEDDARMAQAGFRLDHHLNRQDRLTLQGDLYRGEQGPEYEGLLTPGQEYNGGNLRFQWSHWANPDRNHEFSAYYDRTHLESGEFNDQRQVWDADYRLLQRWRNHELVGGLSYRHLSDEVRSPAQARFIPPRRSDEVQSAFLQDDIGFLDNRLHLVVGTKYEVNDYSGEEWQPNVRASYAFTERALLWAAWSKAVRTPTRLEHDALVSDRTGTVVLDANDHLNPEYAEFYELGWRQAWANVWQVDLAAYVGKYRDLMTTVISPDNPEVLTLGNAMEGDIKGVEASVTLQAATNWLVRLNYTHAELDITSKPGNLDTERGPNIAGSTPNDMLKLISLWDINDRWQLNTYLRYVDELPARDASSYWVADLSLVWRVLPQTRLQLVGRHLGQGDLEEWGPGVNAVEPDWALYLTHGF